jgi:hypothetical protein
MLDPAFGNWLAGFTDGEGCFCIFRLQKTTNRSRVNYQCQFVINLRADDAAILVEIRDRLGIGKISKRNAKSPLIVNQNPQVKFCITSKPGCIILRDIFLAHPLRAKKAGDFKIWCEALEYWISHEQGGSWDDMADAKMRLEAGRKFHGEGWVNP